MTAEDVEGRPVEMDVGDAVAPGAVDAEPLAGRVVLEDPNVPDDARKAAVEEWRKALPK